MFRISSREMTKELAFNLPIITVVGNVRVHIENYKAIIEISEEEIKILTKKGCLKVIGKRLSVEYYDHYEIDIRGFIVKVEV